MKTPLRVYADTSVFGGCFEEKFSEASTRFFEQVRDGTFILVVSDVTLEELDPAPQYVKSLLDSVPADHTEQVVTSDVSKRLQSAYLDAAVVGPACENDAASRSPPSRWWTSLSVGISNISCITRRSWGTKASTPSMAIAVHGFILRMK